MYEKYKSPFGYQVGDNGIDSYGVDHSGFSLRDEIEYQTARDNRESQMMQMYNQQGIMENYPQYTTNFWGYVGNNYGFGSSNISSAISTHPAMNTTPTLLQPVQTSMPQAQSSAFLSNGYSNSLNNSQGFDTNTTSQPQSGVWAQQRQRAVENDMLMNSMDVLYGMNRTINGMTFGGSEWLGNKLGYDTRMNDYLQLKNPQARELTQNVGQLAQMGGGVLSGDAIAQAVYNQANMAYNGYKIGKAYDKLSVDPFKGKGSDIIARMKNHNGEPVILQRGEAILGENGQPVVYGKNLRRETGTLRNYGMDKIIHKHEMPRNEVIRIPQYLKQYQPMEVSPRGQNVYAIQQSNGEIRLVTTPKDGGNIVSSMYYLNK